MPCPATQSIPSHPIIHPSIDQLVHSPPSTSSQSDEGRGFSTPLGLFGSSPKFPSPKSVSPLESCLMFLMSLPPLASFSHFASSGTAHTPFCPIFTISGPDPPSALFSNIKWRLGHCSLEHSSTYAPVRHSTESLGPPCLVFEHSGTPVCFVPFA